MTPRPSPPPHIYTPPGPGDLTILHRDDDLIVTDKPSGLLSVPGRGADKTASAVSYLQAIFGEVHVVHRLDMDTSGLLVFARHKEALRSLARQFQDRRVEKTYIAVVEGRPGQIAGTIRLPIAAYSLARPLRHVDPDGQEAITHWVRAASASGTSRLVLRPETGRSHQLRLHLAEIGHPILGDPFYGRADAAPRLLLHASRLGFQHPSRNVTCLFETSPCF